MTKNKIIAIVTVVALIAVAVIGGTLAYFTDTDKATNAFTAGNVDITLHEANTEGAQDEEYQTWLEDQVLYPGSKTTNNLAKIVTVENTGKSEAYVRVHIAIPQILDNGDPEFDAGKNVLHFNADADSYTDGLWNWGKKVTIGRNNFVGSGDNWNFYEATIDGIAYNVYVVTYETILDAEATTAKAAMTQVYLDSKVTNADVESINEVLGENWKILVVAEGCQTAGFDNAFDALNTSFGTPGSYTVEWPTA